MHLDRFIAAWIVERVFPIHKPELQDPQDGAGEVARLGHGEEGGVVGGGSAQVEELYTSLRRVSGAFEGFEEGRGIDGL